MRVLIACEFSGVVRRAFRERGYDAWSCDLLASEDESPYHIQGDATLELLFADRWDLLIAHPPCTYLTNSGSLWLYAQDDPTSEVLKGARRWAAMREGANLFKRFLDAPVRFKAIENPIMHEHAFALIGSRATQFVQPWHFGYQELKATGFHLENLPKLKPTKVIQPPADPKIRRLWARVHQASPGPDRWKVRSRTNPGIAAAMAEQWGAHVMNKLSEGGDNGTR